MDTANVSAIPPRPTHVHRSDLRPTADSAAIARDPRPEVPLPIPPNNRPVGAVNESRMGESAEKKSVVVAVERVLKPYGIAILPYVEDDTAGPPDKAQETDDPDGRPADVSAAADDAHAGSDPDHKPA